MGGPIYRAYERRLIQQLRGLQVPRHVGVILDGNRRWARERGAVHVSQGHRRGADKIDEFLVWCSAAGVEVVTLWLLSTDNLSRPPEELDPAARRHRAGGERPFGARSAVAGASGRRARPAARLDGARPEGSGRGDERQARAARQRRRRLRGPPRDRRRGPQPAAGERGQRARRIGEVAETLDVDHIAEHLYTKGQPDPDLVIRTSGEQRLSGFLLWQSAHSEFYFCEAYWPDFRRTDFLRALRAYGERSRRYGS